MFDIKSMVKRSIEKEMMNVEDYVFLPERIEMPLDGGHLISVLNSDGSVDFFFNKDGITEVASAARKHPYTAFETELHHGVYDDVIENLVKDVDKVLDGKSKYFRTRILSSGMTNNPNYAIRPSDEVKTP